MFALVLTLKVRACDQSLRCPSKVRGATQNVSIQHLKSLKRKLGGFHEKTAEKVRGIKCVCPSNKCPNGPPYEFNEKLREKSFYFANNKCAIGPPY
jgi:hypothetical protein